MQEPLVSILIPFKNTEDFLQKCLLSIVNQSYTHWQVIAINDHSTDASKLIVEKFSRQDTRIKVFDNKGAGIISALRMAYSKSDGQLITRMDSDDLMTSNKLKVMVTSLLEFGKGHLAVGQVKYFSGRGISNGYARYERWLNKLTAKGENYSEIYKECVIPSPCWMVYKDDLDLCAAFKPELYPEDYDLAFRFYENGLKCIPCKQVIHHWRDYDTRTSRTSHHYAQNYFLDIKLYYFLKLDQIKNRPLTVWGAGNKGKTIAKKLIELNVEFYWLCDNPNKIGKNIYGKTMLHFSIITELNHPQSIITVANATEQDSIRNYFKGLNQKHRVDYFFFC